MSMHKKRNSAELDLQRFGKRTNEQIGAWIQAMSAFDFKEAADLAIAGIQWLTGLKKETSQPEIIQARWGARIVLNGLRDFANLQIIVSQCDWLECPDAVEEAWILLHNSHERLTRYVELERGFCTMCVRSLQEISDSIYAKYGPGIYMSWEVLVNSYICSICNVDIRGCEHISGKWYGDHRCRAIARDIQPQKFAIVKNPRDPRCRIWPWKRSREVAGGNVIFKDILLFALFDPEGNEEAAALTSDINLLAGAIDRFR